jgi:ABC-2 type transport system ATP-binding protein
MSVIQSTALGKRYQHTWALRDCTLDIPGGHVVALVGPDGAGKTTLLTMAAGLTRPTEGSVTVLGGVPVESADALEGIAFVAQDAPLDQNLPVTDLLRVARALNRCWDARRADDRLEMLGISPRRPVGDLSGGQRAQLALTIALARRPGLLLLDEPLSALDPGERDDFLASVVEAARDDGLSVVLSSRRPAELERVASFLIVLSGGQVRVAGLVNDLLASGEAGLEDIALHYLRAGVPSASGPSAGSTPSARIPVATG